MSEITNYIDKIKIEADKITPEVLKAGVTAFGVDGTLDIGENLEDQLNAQDQIIQELQKALENKTASGEPKLNVYMQENEPENKDGIWLESNKTFDKVYFDTNVKKLVAEGWDTLTQYPSFKNKPGLYPSTMVGDYLYVFNGDDTDMHAQRMNYKTNIIEDLGIQPEKFTDGMAVSIGTDIYITGRVSKYKLYKYDTLTNEFLKLDDIAIPLDCALAAVGTDVYIIGGQSTGDKKMSKYDTLTGTLVTITTTMPVNFMDNSRPAVIGDNIYLMSASGSSSSYKISYMFNTKNNSFTQLADNPKNSIGGITCVVDNYIYIFGKAAHSTLYNVCYKYNTLTDTYETIADSPINFFASGAGYAYLINGNKIIITNGVQDSLISYGLTYSSIYDYDDKSIVVWDGFGKYRTQFYAPARNQGGKLLSNFYNAYHYTTENGLDDTIPLYYGNGTEWVKIRGGAE